MMPDCLTKLHGPQMTFELRPGRPFYLTNFHMIWKLLPVRSAMTRLTLLLRSLPHEAATQFAEQECWRQLKAAVTPAYERDLQRVQAWFHQVFKRCGCDNLHEFLRKKMVEIRRVVDDDSSMNADLTKYENLVYETKKPRHLSDETISDAYHYGFWPTSTSEDKFQAIVAYLGVRIEKVPQISPEFLAEAKARKKREKARKATWTFPE